jgi:hypothetical protein
MDPCHHIFVHPQDANWGDGLQVRRTAANTLNNQLQTADKGWASSLAAEGRANNALLQKNMIVPKLLNDPSTWTDSLGKQHKLQNMDTR